MALRKVEVEIGNPDNSPVPLMRLHNWHRSLPYATLLSPFYELLGLVVHPTGKWFVRFLWAGLVICLASLGVSLYFTSWDTIDKYSRMHKAVILALFYAGLSFTLSFAYTLCYVYDPEAFLLRLGPLQAKATAVRDHTEITRRFGFNTAAALVGHSEFLPNLITLVPPWGPPAEREFIDALIQAGLREHEDNLKTITKAMNAIPYGERQKWAIMFRSRYSLPVYTHEELTSRYSTLGHDLKEFAESGRLSPLLQELGMRPPENEREKALSVGEAEVAQVVLEAGDRCVEEDTRQLGEETANTVRTVMTHANFLYLSSGSIITITFGDITPNSRMARILVTVQAISSLFLLYVLIPIIRIQ